MKYLGKILLFFFFVSQRLNGLKKSHVQRVTQEACTTLKFFFDSSGVFGFLINKNENLFECL